MDEREIVEGLRRGERRAFDAMYSSYRGRIHAFLLRLSGRRDVAEDLFQETWLKAARAAERLREDTSLASWLFTIARNEYRSYRRWSVLDLSRLVALGDEDPHGGTSPDDDADAARELRKLEQALRSLPAGHREVLLLVAVEGFEQDEAAKILGLKYDALRQRLSRARGALAEAMAKIVEVPA